MNPMDRITSEREFHDEQARRRAETFRRDTRRQRFRDRDYLDHETWIRYAWSRLGPLAGKRILDYGCGHGMAAVVMARHGAEVSAFDLSPDYIAEAQRRADANEVSIDWRIADAHTLPWPDASFDAVWGNAILHHLDLRVAGRELRRVMRPGSVAVFCEPWGENPLLRWARQRLPYPGKERTRDEEPLREHHVAAIRETFPHLQWRGFQLLAMVRRVLPIQPLIAGLTHLDSTLFELFPRLEKWCRYVVLTLQRE